MTHSERSPASDGRVEPEHRLHPMTLVLRAVVSIPALAFLLYPVFVSPDSTAVLNVVLSFLYALVVLPWVVLYYLRFRYRLSPHEVVIHSGVLTRRRRNIPVDRIQNIEIEQQLLQRLTGTARVRIYTAGSQQAEGALDVVSLQEAQRIREAVRAYQRQAGRLQHKAVPDGDWIDSPVETRERPAPEAISPRVEGTRDLHAMSGRRVLLSGLFRFSPLYLVIIFTTLQWIEPDPEAILSWISPEQLEDLSSAATRSPWTTALAAVVVASLLGWLSGIAVNVNRWFGFRLRLEGDKLYRRHGLLSVREGTIPLRRIQALIVRTNPLMRRFGWYALEVQTMGIDVREQGHSVAMPFASLDEVREVAHVIRGGMPEQGTLDSRLDEDLRMVSSLTIRRALVRYTVMLLLLGAGIDLWSQWDGRFVAMAWPLALLWAWLRWRSMGFDLRSGHLFVRRGVVRQTRWVIPVGRLQVLHTRASLFQRRLRLRTVYVDTAGASPVRGADIIDLDADEADALALSAYRQFQAGTD